MDTKLAVSKTIKQGRKRTQVCQQSSSGAPEPAAIDSAVQFDNDDDKGLRRKRKALWAEADMQGLGGALHPFASSSPKPADVQKEPSGSSSAKKLVEDVQQIGRLPTRGVGGAPQLAASSGRRLTGLEFFGPWATRASPEEEERESFYDRLAAEHAETCSTNVAINGAAARVITIPVGVSFEDRGMGYGQHDDVAVVLSFRGASQPSEKRLTVNTRATPTVSRPPRSGMVKKAPRAPRNPRSPSSTRQKNRSPSLPRRQN